MYYMKPINIHHFRIIIRNHKTDITYLLLPVAKMLTVHSLQSKGIAFEENKFFQQSVGHSGTIQSHYCMIDNNVSDH